MSLGSTWFGSTPQLADGLVFEAKVTHIFKIIRKENQGTATPSPTPTGGKPGTPAPSSSPAEAHGRLPRGRQRHVRLRQSAWHRDALPFEVGEGDPILFLHGNPVWSYVWRHLFKYLSPYGCCIAPDLIGFRAVGGQARHRLRSEEHYQYIGYFIEELKLRNNITLVIQDWGSGLGFRYASEPGTYQGQPSSRRWCWQHYPGQGWHHHRRRTGFPRAVPEIPVRWRGWRGLGDDRR